MLSKKLKRISPKLASFLDYSSPDILEEDVEVFASRAVSGNSTDFGKCFLFSYRNPKGKGSKKLPYYHLFPMIFLLDATADTLLGLNPFYLPPARRKVLINGVMDRLNNDVDDYNARAILTYDVIDKYRNRYKDAFPCIKRYRRDLMGKVALEIKPVLWKEFYLGDVSVLHESLFVGASRKTIWRESLEISRKESRKK